VRLRVDLPGELAAGLRAVGARLGVSPYAVARAAFDVLIHRLTGLADFAVGTIVDMRPPEVKGPIVGFCLNTLPLRSRIGEGSFATLARDTHAALSRARAHAEAPFDEIVRRKAPARRTAVNPLIQIVFGFMPKGTRAVDMENAEALLWNVDHDRARFDVSLMLEETEAGIGGFVEYATDIYDEDTMRRLIDRYALLLGAALDDPEREIGDYPVIAPAEMERLMALGRGPVMHYPPESSVAEVFRRIARGTPAATAIEKGTRRVTYGELDAWSDAVAAALAARGVGVEEVVAISGERTPEVIAGMLGILKAGAAHLVLDPALPPARAAHMLGDAGARIVLMQEGSALAVPAGMDRMALPAPGAAALPFPCPAGPRTLAYLCYTSGSTGLPKAVEVEHRGILRLILGGDWCDFGPDERVMQTGSLGFDVSTFEVWAPLLHGGTLVQPEANVPSLSDYARTIEAHGVTTAWFTAGLFRHMVDARPDALARIRQVLAGGDAVSPDHALRLLEVAPELRLINGYGPTENTTFSLCGPIDAAAAREGSAPIGFTIANSTAWILDDRMRLVPFGAEGDLYVGGDGVARGYRGRPEATAAAFLSDPFDPTPGARLYKTGDRARYRADGRMEFLGRRDGQIKIRGFRVETGEIEAVLREHPGVRDAVVIPRREDGTVRSLGAAIIPAGAAVPALADLRGFLGGRLPDYMIPTDVIAVPEFPLNQSGKIDRQALLSMWEAKPAASAPDRVPPRTPVEALIFDVWRELLKREDFGIDDDFFAVGGHSLLVMQLTFRIEEETGLAFSNLDVFANPTIRRLGEMVFARLLEEEGAA
jgi:amino acid adenylation domain-containing protein